MLIFIQTNNKMYLRIRSIIKNGFLIPFSQPMQISSLFLISLKQTNTLIFGFNSKLAPQRCHNLRLVQVPRSLEIKIIYSDLSLSVVLGLRIWDIQKIQKYLESHALLRMLSRVRVFNAIYTLDMILIRIQQRMVSRMTSQQILG